MNLNQRLKWMSLLLLAGAGLSWTFQRHIEGDAVFTEPRAALSSVPHALHSAAAGSPCQSILWSGKEHPARAELLKQVPFADEVLYRYYVANERGPMVQVYAAYSRTGEDRKHHPEICIREVAGAPEDLAARQVLPLDAEGSKQAQRFRFLKSKGGHSVVYYWHCTFPAVLVDGQTALQAFHRHVASRSPSITVQVVTGAQGQELEMIERGFLPALEAALSAKVLPPGTVIGCDRMPVTLLRR